MSRRRQTPHVHMIFVRLLTVPPIALGAWSVALVLWQPPEYYCIMAPLMLARGVCCREVDQEPVLLPC